MSTEDKAEKKATTTVQECPEEPCPPCVPPVGTRAYQIDSGHDHGKCKVPQLHVHIYVRYQQPKSAGGPSGKPCECGWKKLKNPYYCLNPGETFTPEPGMIVYSG